MQGVPSFQVCTTRARPSRLFVRSPLNAAMFARRPTSKSPMSSRFAMIAFVPVARPINMIHWASSAVGCPPIWGSKAWLNGKIAMGGVDERPFGQNKAEEIGRLARTTLQKMQNEPFLLAPDCSVSVHTQDDELRAFRASVEESLR